MATIISQFVAVWTELTTFLVGLFPSVMELFFADGSLTFVGVMAVIMGGISIVLLIFNLIRSFFSFHG
jgi:hypothetical protein